MFSSAIPASVYSILTVGSITHAREPSLWRLPKSGLKLGLSFGSLNTFSSWLWRMFFAIKATTWSRRSMRIPWSFEHLPRHGTVILWKRSFLMKVFMQCLHEVSSSWIRPGISLSGNHSPLITKLDPLLTGRWHKTRISLFIISVLTTVWDARRRSFSSCQLRPTRLEIWLILRMAIHSEEPNFLGSPKLCFRCARYVAWSSTNSRVRASRLKLWLKCSRKAAK